MNSFSFGDLVEMVEVKKRINMSSGDNMHNYSGVGLEDAIKVGDVLSRPGAGKNMFYVIVDIRFNKNKTRGFGVNVNHLGNGVFNIEDGATYFHGNKYFDEKLGIDVTQLKEYVLQHRKCEKIKELENKLAKLENELVQLKKDHI